MSFVELVRLSEVIRTFGSRTAMEIGMATGTSSVVIGEAIRQNGGDNLTSIDPFQTSQEGYGSAGMDRVKSAGLAGIHRLIEQPDYLAMPQLVELGARFDFVLIDGYHSFDHTMLNFFYADLLLKDGGIIALHDSTMPAVYHVIRYLEQWKPYERISPPVAAEVKSLALRCVRRVRGLFQGIKAIRQAGSRRRDWKTLSVYRKLESHQAPEAVF